MASSKITTLYKQHQNKINLTSLTILLIIFASFGLYHLAKFETTDEHFWKYDRIEKYYTGMKNGIHSNNWKKTRLNDKPGVTVALINGITVPFGFHPSEHEDLLNEKKYTYGQNKKGEGKKLYDIYHTENTEHINFKLRLPGLLFNAFVILPLLFWLLSIFTKNFFLTFLGATALSINPILIGISQIINPDAFLWGFSTVAIISFFVYLDTRQRKFLILSGVTTGFSLLSKYTANLLFLFYPIIFILYTYFSQNKKFPNNSYGLRPREYFRNYIIPFGVLIFLALLIFSLLMPEVVQIRKHFLYGTFYSPTFAPLVDGLITFFNLHDIIFFSPTKYRTALMFPLSVFVFILMTIVIPFFAIKIIQKFKKHTEYLLRLLILLMLSIFIYSLINAWADTPFFSLTDIKETSRHSGKLIFPSFSHNSKGLFWYKALTVEAQNLIFSLPSIILISVLFLWIRTLQNKIITKKFLPFIYFASIFMPLVFFIGALFANIFVNIRYSLMIFPLFSILGAIGIYEFFLLLLKRKLSIAERQPQLAKSLLVLLFIAVHLLATWSIKPYYFNYHSMLLPHKYVVTDSWGYGAYAASKFLNALPKAKTTTIWTDRRSMCQFFVGHCIVSNEIYLDAVNVDYLIFSRRGMITKKFIPVGNNDFDLTREKYYSDSFIKKHTVFEEQIGNRPENFIKIIKVEK